MFYSQCGEDEFLNNNYFKNKREGTYIELGAMDGVLYSNTKYFEDNLAWNGVLIEPHPYNYFLLQKNRSNNNFLFNNLISCYEEEVLFKFFFENYSGVSGIENTLPKEHYDNFYHKLEDPLAAIVLKPTSLTSIIKRTDIKHFDLLSLDVEGHEYEVLLSWDFSIPIDIIMIETLGESQCEKEELCRKLLVKNDYVFDAKYKHNEIFILKSSVYMHC
jgi:FkbM family methyltransferase